MKMKRKARLEAKRYYLNHRRQKPFAWLCYLIGGLSLTCTDLGNQIEIRVKYRWWNPLLWVMYGLVSLVSAILALSVSLCQSLRDIRDYMHPVWNRIPKRNIYGKEAGV